MDNRRVPHVILRYDSEPSRGSFEAYFGKDFTITPVISDAAAMAHLAQTGGRPAAIFVLSDEPADQVGSQLLIKARDEFSGVLRILVCDAMPLELLVSLLDSGLVDRVFESPINPDRIRSEVLAAALSLPAPPPTIDPLTLPTDGLKPAVLIVDDETVATRYLARQLERLQDEFRLLCAATADEALAVIREQGDAIAVVMSDQRMPGLSGKALLDELKQSHPDMVRILTSAYGEVDVALGAVNEGRIFRYQTKPWQARELLELFRKALAHHWTLVAARSNSRSLAERQFAELREQRRQRLLDAMEQVLGPVRGSRAITGFLESIRQVSTLPANTSHLRASHDTALERDLIRQFADLLTREWDGMPGTQALPQPPTQHQLRTGLEDALARGEQVGVVGPPSALALFCRSLATLLQASGMGGSDLVIGQQGGAITLATSRAFRMYSHLLAPLTRISQPLLQQQVAFLLVHITAALLGAELSVTGGQQRFELQVRFAALGQRGSTEAGQEGAADDA